MDLIAVTGRRALRPVPSVLVALSWIATPFAHALPGEVLSEQKISSVAGGFGGRLLDTDQFGIATIGIGDLDRDGIEDLAAGA